MPTQIYINLPVNDLSKTKSFFEQLGYSFNAQFTDEKAACMIISNDIYIMLLRRDFFETFTHKKVIDAKENTEVLICLSAENRNAVDELVQKAITAGGKAHREPMDHGMMYQWAFEDLDGHIWEIAWMDENFTGAQ